MNDELETSDVKEYEADFSNIPKAHIAEMHQEGNWIHGLTDNGIRFRQHIKQGKRLNMKEGQYVIEDVEVVQATPETLLNEQVSPPLPPDDSSTKRIAPRQCIRQ